MRRREFITGVRGGVTAAGIGTTGAVGAPALVIGRTNGSDSGDDTSNDGRYALAWTVTSGRDDVVDTVAVDLHPDDRHRYRLDGEWYEMETHEVEHVASPVPPALGDDPETRAVELGAVRPGGVDRLEHPVELPRRDAGTVGRNVEPVVARRDGNTDIVVRYHFTLGTPECRPQKAYWSTT